MDKPSNNATEFFCRFNTEASVFLLTVVVTTTSSSALASGFNVISIICSAPGATITSATSFVSYPKYEKVTVYVPGSTSRTYFPSKSDVVPFVVPLIRMLAKGRTSLNSPSFTVPDIIPSCADII